MTCRRAGGVAAGLLTVALLIGCSGGGDDPAPHPATTSTAPSSPRTPPPISPRTTVSVSPGNSLPDSIPPPPGSGGPIPSVPDD